MTVLPSTVYAACEEPPEAPHLGRRPLWFDAKLSLHDFHRMSAVIEKHAGIRMPDAKRTMVEARLKARLRDLGLSSFSQYIDRALCNGSDEFTHFIDRITTNKTDFFREPTHLEVLVRQAWPALAREHGAGVGRDLTVWCAACSTGEEPYTLAMVLAEAAASPSRPGQRFRILATDLCTKVLDHARRGIYDEARIEPIPRALRPKYLLRSKDRSAHRVRIVPELRDRVTFRRLNLMDPRYPVEGPVDVIFCRNVFIYFDRTTQAQILQRFCRLLVPGGYLFLGHSEALRGDEALLRQVAPTTYRTIAGS